MKTIRLTPRTTARALPSALWPPRLVRLALPIAMCCILAILPGNSSLAADQIQCRPTPPDSLGPFYEPDAPERESVGSGYWLNGVVRSASNCLPIPGARIELWMAGPDGDYDDAFRATVYSRKDGAYRFQSHDPKPYFGRPPHIHIRVSADGHQTLITQHYPLPNSAEGDFDLVLKTQP